MASLSQIISYRKINENNKEFRRSDYWLIEITPPKGIYFPGQDLIQIRTNEFEPGINDNADVLEKKIRGFTVLQGGRVSSTSGTLSLTMMDRVDQTLSYFIDQWKLGVAQRDNLYGLAKDLYVSPIIKAHYYNINEIEIRRLTFYNGIIESGSLQENGSSEAELEPDLSLEIKYEHFTRDFLNVSL